MLANILERSDNFMNKYLEFEVKDSKYRAKQASLKFPIFQIPNRLVADLIDLALILD